MTSGPEGRTPAQEALHWQRLADEFCEFNPYADRVVLHNFAGWLAARGARGESSPRYEFKSQFSAQLSAKVVRGEPFTFPECGALLVEYLILMEAYHATENLRGAASQEARGDASPLDVPTLEDLWNGDVVLTAEQRRWIRQALDAQDRGGAASQEAPEPRP